MIDNSCINLVKRTKYPIFFCKISGRYFKENKRNVKKPKAFNFTIETCAKFDNKGENILSKRFYVLTEKYSVGRNDKVIIDSVVKIKYLSFTYIKD